VGVSVGAGVSAGRARFPDITACGCAVTCAVSVLEKAVRLDEPVPLDTAAPLDNLVPLDNLAPLDTVALPWAGWPLVSVMTSRTVPLSAAATAG
jgi:hypothetical protein